MTKVQEWERTLSGEESKAAAGAVLTCTAGNECC